MEKLGLLLVAVMLFSFVSSAEAVIITGNPGGSTEGLGDFTAELLYNQGTQTLSVNLENTSDAVGYDGYITAFVFNNPDDLISGVSGFTATNANFNLIGGSGYDNGIKGAPYGDFDIGASIGTNSNADFYDGGNPADGIAPGDSEFFTFIFTGTSLESLLVSDFIGELSESAGGGDAQFFAARFRYEESDKVPAGVVNGGNGEPIPEPASMLLLGPALLGLAGLKRKIK